MDDGLPGWRLAGWTFNNFDNCIADKSSNKITDGDRPP